MPTLGIFSTAPEIRNPVANLITEVIATVGLVLPILFFGKNPGTGIGRIPGTTAYGSGIGILIVALLVVGIGLSLGGPTGYAINPARDLAAHHPRPAADSQQGHLGLGLRPDTGGGTADRRGALGPRVQSSLLTL